jgi:hypothetical protein
VDGYSSPRAKKLALQVSKAGLFLTMQGVGSNVNAVNSVNIVIHDL